jgi:hypothetical protein
MRQTFVAIFGAASIAALACAAPAAAQTMYYDNGAPWSAGPTVPSNTGAPAYSWHRTGPAPAVNGQCEIISGNHVCTSGPGYGDGYGYAPGSMVAAPFDAAGMLVAAPMQAAGFVAGAPTYASPGYTVPQNTGTPAYSYASHVPPQPGVVGSCDIISGNHVCVP